jgi:hypothetical protein
LVTHRTETFGPRRASAHSTAHVTPEVIVKVKHVVRVRPAVIVVAATVVLAAAASPAFAQVHSSVEPPVDDSKPRGERIAGAARRAEQFRGRYQLRLSEARKLLGS